MPAQLARRPAQPPVADPAIRQTAFTIEARPEVVGGVQDGGEGGPRPDREQVVRDHLGLVYGVARRMLGTDADAEDVAQEALLRVVRQYDGFRGESAVTTWVYRVAVNAVLEFRRKRAVAREHPLTTADGPLDGGLACRRGGGCPAEGAERREARAALETAIDRLPAGYRDPFVLADVEGLANQEVAELLGLSVAAVKSRLHRARLMLRDALRPHLASQPE